MDKDAECFVSGALATVLRISRFTGLAPLRFEVQGDGWRVSLSRGSSLLGYFFITIVNLVVLLAVIYVSQMKANTTRNVWIAEEVAVAGLVSTMMYGAPQHARCLIACSNQLQTVNSELNHWPTPWTKKQTVLLVTWSTFSLSMISIYFIMLLSVTIMISNESFDIIWVYAMHFLHFALHLFIILGGTQFVLLVLNVRSSFKAVNDCLRSLLRGLKEKHEPMTKDLKVNNYVKSLYSRKTRSDKLVISSSPAQAVRSISSAYASTCDAVRAVNRSYGLMLVAALGTVFLQLIITSYYFILSLVLGYNLVAEIAILMIKYVQFFRCIFHAVCLVLLIEPCHLNDKEMQYTRELVSQLMVSAHSESDLLAVELKQFYWQLELNDVSFKPLDVTTMGRSLVLTIFGSITTYLVILIDSKWN